MVNVSFCILIYFSLAILLGKQKVLKQIFQVFVFFSICSFAVVKSEFAMVLVINIRNIKHQRY